MTRLFASAWRYFGSLAGRIALLLAVGISLAATGALLVTDRARHNDLKRIQAVRVVASAADVIGRLQADDSGTRKSLEAHQLVGARLISTASAGPTYPVNPYVTSLLRDRLNGQSIATVAHVPSAVCMRADPFWRQPRAAGFHVLDPPDCWLLSLSSRGRPLSIGIDLPPLPALRGSRLAPGFLGLVVVASIVLSIIAAQLATAPLRRLSAAAGAFSRSIDAEPAIEAGPSDVRAALATFNLMQERVREGLRERTRILAAISHDLQTPLTRLRLRLEQVGDDELRERLIADLSATMAMVKRGLDLARSGESAEEWTTVNLDSLLSSIADDAADVGAPVRFTAGCGALVRAKLDALTRCLTNLVDNAVKYGGEAEIACARIRTDVFVTVRDRGPGMPPTLLERAFEPFVRGDKQRASGDGSGIGLTIARSQAAAIGAELSLANHVDGGLEATLRLTAVTR